MYVESESNGHIEVVFNGALLKGEEEEVDTRRYVESITQHISTFNNKITSLSQYCLAHQLHHASHQLNPRRYPDRINDGEDIPLIPINSKAAAVKLL